MSPDVREQESIPARDPAISDIEIPITGRTALAAILGGLAGTALMLPVLVGIPQLLGLFLTDPITDFAGIGGFFGIEPTLALGVVVFLVGGTIVLPINFLVTGAFLPPQEPRYVRGATLATIFWTGFVPAFWPGGSTLTIVLFLVVSLVAHWIYGLTLGYVLDRATGIPQHRV